MRADLLRVGLQTGVPVQQKCKVVVAYPDGRRLKGYVYDFSPARDFFFLFPPDHEPDPKGAPPLRTAIRLKDVKAVFFVKDFDGDPRRYDDEAPPAEDHRHGRRLEVTFADGEKMVGISETYHPTKPGFFLFPANPATNNDHVWVLTRSVKVRVVDAGTSAAAAAGTSPKQ